MADPGPTSERLEALRERWRSEPGSRVFLQLADEYRRLGRPDEAARVLEEGLEAHPGHVGAQVALGRCRLETGRSGEAVALLERVVESDPTQMVAYRLLVDAYLDQGKADEARQRLRIYSLLNDADPEIAELRRRIGELDRGGGEETAGAPGPESSWEPQAVGGAGSDPGPEPESGVGGAGDGGTDGEPFPALAGAADRRRYLDGLLREGLFELDLALEREAPLQAQPEVGPEAAPEAEPAPGAGAEEAPPEAAWDEVFDLEVPAGAAPDLSSLLEAPGTAAGAPAAEPPPAPGDRPTVTLGRLYLRQGHLPEAEAIFREVLAREPENAEARRHLEELSAPAAAAPGGPAGELSPAGSPSRPPLAASTLLEGFGGGGERDRKRYVLERYLERIRGRTPRDVH